MPVCGACFTCAEAISESLSVQVYLMLCGTAVDSWNGIEVCACAQETCFAACDPSLCSGNGPDPECLKCIEMSTTCASALSICKQ